MRIAECGLQNENVDIRIQRRSLERIEDFLCFVKIAFLFRDPRSAIRISPSGGDCHC
jgi:hypothetical protein